MSRIERLFQGIADALFSTPGERWATIGIAAGVVLLLLAVAGVQRLLQRSRMNRAFETRFRKEIRRLDLTIRQLDVIERLSRHLNDRTKKYLLLTNKQTFHHCRRAAGVLPEDLAASVESLEAKLGFSSGHDVAPNLDSYTPRVGTVVRIEGKGTGMRSAAEVVSCKDRTLTVRPQTPLDLSRGAEMVVYASHPSGIVTAQGTLEVASQPEVEIRLTRMFQEPDARSLADNALKVFVRPEGKPGDPQPTVVRQLWPRGATLDNPGGLYRRRDDIQIVLRRNHASWVVVNAEVVRLRSRRRLMSVRFSHLSSEARREILGKA